MGHTVNAVKLLERRALRNLQGHLTPSTTAIQDASRRVTARLTAEHTRAVLAR